jgi:two-component system sensor histidine kinase HydH
VDPWLQASPIAALLSAALGLHVLLRSGDRRLHRAFASFAFAVTVWYVCAFARKLSPSALTERLHLGAVVFVARLAIQFFRAFVGESDRRASVLTSSATLFAVALVFLLASPVFSHAIVGAAVIVYVLFSFWVAMDLLRRRGLRTTSRLEAARLRFLGVVGGIGGVLTLVDYVPYWAGIDVPPLGTIFLVGFLYMLSQSVLRERLVDLYEVAGRVTVLLVLALLLSSTVWLLGRIAGDHFFLHSFVAAVVVLLVSDPLRNKVEAWISRVFFWERFELEERLVEARRRIPTSLDLPTVAGVAIDALEGSRRVTHASIYLADRDRRGFALLAHTGPEPPARVEAAPARPLLERLTRSGALVLEHLERELESDRVSGHDREAETTYEIVHTLEVLHTSVCIPIVGRDGLYGLLNVRGARFRDAFSADEILLLTGLASQVALAVESARLYQATKERDRLAALGEMSAGLAHEIRNPLGAIKASAQYLVEPGAVIGDEVREFLDIIVEETDRLNRVVGAFLDYARPDRAAETSVSVLAVVQRTLQLVARETQAFEVRLDAEAGAEALQARIDAERLRQVLLNLVRNAIEAMGERGVLTVRLLSVETRMGSAVEIHIRDTGPGIPEEMLPRLFVPFVTTKERGTGLGLAISQRIIDAADGTIDLSSEAGKGTLVRVRLPAGPRESEALEDGAQSESAS